MGSLYHNKRFHNQNRHLRLKSFKDFIQWQRTRSKKPWPKRVDSQPKHYEPVPDQNALSYTYIGHASVLIECEGMTFLTDPVFSKRISPIPGFGPKRVRPPAVLPETLPKIDVVLLSHNHYDHMDIPTLKWLKKRDNPLILTGLNNNWYLHRHNIRHCYELGWGGVYHMNGFSVYYELAQHWSKRLIKDDCYALWGSFVVKSPEGKMIYFAGDSGYASHFSDIYDKHGRADLALLPIGAYEPRWFMKDYHMNPSEAVQAHLDLHSEHSVGIHFGTFCLTDEGIDEPVEALIKARKDQGVLDKQFEIPRWGVAQSVS